MTYEWKIFVKDRGNNYIGQLDDYDSATFAPQFCDVGTWSVEMSRSSPMVPYLITPGYGIVATRDGHTVFSGLQRTPHHVRTADQDHVTISGDSDDAWLLSRLVSPSPADSGPPYTLQVSDVRTGIASTVINQYVDVNLGPGAVAGRRKTDLTIGADPVIGATVRGEARWDSNLLAFLQPLALTGGVGFRIAQVGTGLVFQVYQPTDRSATVQFSVGLGNLKGFEYESKAPTANYVYVGASGTGTARIIQEFSDSDSISTWGRWEGNLVNQGGTTDPTSIAQSGTDALAQGAEQASLSITPLETETLRYGIDYFLGDTVTVQLDGPAVTPYGESGQIVDTLRKVEITLTPDGQTVTPSVGTGNAQDVARIFRRLAAYDRRLNNLERL